MSEFLADALVVVRPDTTRFRALLETELRAATAKPLVVPVQPVVVGGGAASSAVLNKELNQQRVIQEQLGASTARATVATREFAAAQTAATNSAAKLAFAQEGVHGAASAVGAAQVTLTRSTAAVAAAQRELALALKAGNAELIAAARGSVRLAEAQALEAETALIAARAQAVHAAALASVNKAAVASTAGFLGLRGAVLTAGTAFIAAIVGFEAVKKAIKGASDLNEEINKTSEVFHASSGEILDWSETTASSIGIARVEALSAVGTFGELFRTLGVGPEKAAELSRALVELSSDFASFFNANPEQVLAAIQSGLVGQARPLRQFGVFLTEARVKQEALNQSGKESVTQLTQQEKILARYTLILRDGAIASGDFARTQEELANQSRILAAEVSDLSDEIGQMAVGPVTQIVGALRQQIAAYKDLVTLSKLAGGAIADLNKKSLEAAAGSQSASDKVIDFEKNVAKLYFRTVLLGPVLTGASLAVDKLGLSAERAAPKVDVLSSVFGSAIGALDDFGAALRNAEKKREAQAGGGTASVLGRIAGFDERKVQAQIRGDTDVLLSVLQEEQAFLESQLERIFVQKRPKLRRQIQNALLGTVNEIASAQKSGSTEVKKVAEDAARAQRDADQALLGLLSNRRDDADRRIAAAAETEGLQDDIRSQNRLQALIKQQITKVRARITDEQARKAAIRELRIALIASRQEEDALRAQQRQDAAARRAEGINLDIDFAEITGNVAREIAARQKLIALLKKQQAGVKKGTAEWKRLRNEIATQQQAIKEAKGQAEQNQDSGQSAQQFFFEQLQAQQGFASNLLGNLITGSTAGLVGVPSDNLAGGPGRGIQVAASVQEGKAGGGPSAGQASTTNDLLTRILRQLKALNQAGSAPEADRQRKKGSAIMDGGGGNVEVM